MVDTTFIDTIEVHTSPTSNFSFSDNNCIDFNINFIDSSLLADFYNWDFGVTTSILDISTATNPSFTFPDSGTYSVMLIAGTNSSICPDTSYQLVAMYPLLSPFFTKPANQCINGNSFDFNAGGAFYGTTQIDWDFGITASPITSSIANPTGVTFSSIGLKPISIRYRANGCDTPYYDTIEVYQSPFSDFSSLSKKVLLFLAISLIFSSTNLLSIFTKYSFAVYFSKLARFISGKESTSIV